MWPFFFQGRHPSGRLLEKPAPAKSSMIGTRQGHLPQKGLWRVLGEVLSFTCAGDPCQKYLWGTLGAQVIDTKVGHLPQKHLWWVIGRVLSFTCAGDPCQKCF